MGGGDLTRVCLQIEGGQPAGSQTPPDHQARVNSSADVSLTWSGGPWGGVFHNEAGLPASPLGRGHL